MNPNEMEAGLELDALVAEKVMGWTEWDSERPDIRPEAIWRVQQDATHVGEPWCVMVYQNGDVRPWYPSFDISAAWEVLEVVD